jgi:hypothetical protein
MLSCDASFLTPPSKSSNRVLLSRLIVTPRARGTGSARCANRIGRVEIFFPRRCPNGCSLFLVFTQGGGQASAHVRETVWSTIMAKFLFIYREPTERCHKPSPEEMQALQGSWYAWMQKVQLGDFARRRRVEAYRPTIEGWDRDRRPLRRSQGNRRQLRRYPGRQLRCSGGNRSGVSARAHDRDPRIGRLRMSEPRLRSI